MVGGMTDIDQRRLDEAMAINAIGEVRQPLTAESLVSLLAAQFGVWPGDDDVATFYEHVGERITKIQEEASAAKFREALRASAPSDSIRDDRTRLLDMIGASTIDEALSVLRNHGEQRRQMHQAIGAMERRAEEQQRVIDRQDERLVALNQRVMDAEDDAAAAREDFADLVDLYTKAIR